MRHLVDLLRRLASTLRGIRLQVASCGATRTDGALARVTYDSTNNVLRIIPWNSEAKTVLDAAYTDASALTTVVVAQEDASLGGYGDTSAPYYLLKLTLS